MKKKRTLLLDYYYQVACIITWKRAITLAVTGKADVLQEYEDEHITSTLRDYKLPSVLRINNKGTRVIRTIKFTRNNVYLRDGYICQYCGEQKPREQLTFDHVIPKCRDKLRGKWDNIVTCCYGCNQRKGNRTPEESGMVLLKKPVKPSWLKFEHEFLESEKEEWKLFI